MKKRENSGKTDVLPHFFYKTVAIWRNLCYNKEKVKEIAMKKVRIVYQDGSVYEGSLLSAGVSAKGR